MSRKIQIPVFNATAYSDDDKTFEVVPHSGAHFGPLAGQRNPRMPLLQARAKPMAATNRGKAARVKGRKKRGGKRGGSRNGGRGWLSGTSLQDVADFTGAIWRYGRAALTLMGNVEEKYFDVQAVAQNCVAATSATVVNLSNIVQGTDWNQRLGNSIRAMNLRVDVALYPGASTTYTFARVIVFRDLMQSGTDPTVAQLLENTSAPIGSPYLHYTADRFEVMCDEVFPFGVTNGVGPGIFHKRLAFRIADHILYSSTAGADASNWQGALYLLYFSDQGTAANQPLIHYYSRLDFTDN